MQLAPGCTFRLPVQQLPPQLPHRCLLRISPGDSSWDAILFCTVCKVQAMSVQQQQFLLQPLNLEAWFLTSAAASAWLAHKRLLCGAKAQAEVVSCIQAKALTSPGTLSHCTLQSELAKATCIANPLPTWSGPQQCVGELKLPLTGAIDILQTSLTALVKTRNLVCTGCSRQ